MGNELTASQGSIGADKEALVRDLKQVMRDADVLLKDVGSITAEGLALARGTVEAKVGVVKDRLAETRDAVVARTRQTADATSGYVKDNIWTVVGVAVVAGVVAGLMTARR